MDNDGNFDKQIQQGYEDLLTPKLAAKMLGISPKTLWNWYHTGKIKGYMLPTKKLRYPKSEITKIVGQMEKIERGML